MGWICLCTPGLDSMFGTSCKLLWLRPSLDWERPESSLLQALQFSLQSGLFDLTCYIIFPSFIGYFCHELSAWMDIGSKSFHHLAFTTIYAQELSLTDSVDMKHQDDAFFKRAFFNWNEFWFHAQNWSEMWKNNGRQATNRLLMLFLIKILAS